MTEMMKTSSHYYFNKEHNMAVGVILLCVVLGLVEAFALAHNGRCAQHDSRNDATMGHHYQRDVVFHDMFGL